MRSLVLECIMEGLDLLVVSGVFDFGPQNSDFSRYIICALSGNTRLMPHVPSDAPAWKGVILASMWGCRPQ